MKILGIVRKVFPTETVGANGFKKRIIWVEETEVQYPNFYPVEFTQANTTLLDSYKMGDVVEVEADVKGRYYKKPGDGKEMVFVTISGYKIEKIQAGKTKPTPSTRQQTGGMPSTAAPGSVDINSDADDDLPF